MSMHDNFDGQPMPDDLRRLDEAIARLGAAARREATPALTARIVAASIDPLRNDAPPAVAGRIGGDEGASRAAWGFWRAAAAIAVIGAAGLLVSQWRTAPAPETLAAHEEALDEVDAWLTSFDESALFVSTDLDALRDDVARLDADDSSWTVDEMWITSEGDSL